MKSEELRKYDIVIVSHETDFYKIKYILEYAKKYLNFDEVHLILSDRSEFKDKDILSLLNLKIFYHNENDILQIDKSRIKHRPNWIYQMLLKMFQNVTKNDDYLILESDSIINSNIQFFDGDKTIFYTGRDQNHAPYFEFSKKMMNLGREFNHSFICEFMMYNKSMIQEMLKISGFNTKENFINKLYDIVELNKCYPADYEFYGNFCFKYFKDKYDIRPISYSQNAKHGDTIPGFHHHWSEQEILDLVNRNSDKSVISFHTYKN